MRSAKRRDDSVTAIPPNFGGAPTPDPPAESTGGALLADGLLLGTAAAILAGAAWWAVTSTMETQYVFGSILVGLVVGRAMLLGARRPGVAQAIMSAVLTAASLVVAEYFIQRSLAISQAGASVPLWIDFDTAYEVVKHSITEEPLTGVFWGISVLAAIVASSAGRSR